MRLINGNHSLEGRIEVCINRAWGTVCSEAFTASEANVVCQGLNFTSGKFIYVIILFFRSPLSSYVDTQSPVARVNAAFGKGVGPIYLNRLDCLGSESGLLDCDSQYGRSVLGVVQCTHAQDAGVVCPGMEFILEGSRLYYWV